MMKESLELTQPTMPGASADSHGNPNALAPDYRSLPDTISGLPVNAEDDEEALESYMSSMLERLTGSTGSVPARIEPLQPEPIDAIVEDSTVVAKAPRETVRPSELNENLTGMRELANQNVESALGVHTYGQLAVRAKSTLALALGISLSSTLLGLIDLSWTYPAAIAGTAVAALVSLRYFGLSRRLAKIGPQSKFGTE